MEIKELGDVLDLETKGPGDYRIERLRDLERLPVDQAPADNHLYFVENRKMLNRFPRITENGAVLTTESLAESFPRALVAPDKKARLAFIRLLQHYDNTPDYAGVESCDQLVHPSARVSPDAAVMPGAVVMEGAVIRKECRIFPGVVIEPCAEIDEGTTIHPNVVIGHHCMIGKRVIIHAGTVIGADGFGFHDQDGQRYKVPQIGNVIVADDVEIGACCTIDRATIESTTIGWQTKIDDQVHIAHNCQLGRFIYIAGQSGLAGSVVMEDGSMLSGNVAVKDHLRVSRGSIVLGGSGIAHDTEPGKIYFGLPARPALRMHRMNLALEKLPEMMTRFKKLVEKLDKTDSPA